MEARSQYVVSALSSLLYSSDSEAGLRQYWMPDDISLECYECTSKFTSFRRRHHCRVCGQVFCSKCCSSYIPGKHVGHNGNLRVCTFCFRSFQSMLEQGGLESENLVESERKGVGEAVQYRRRQSIDQVAQLTGSQPYLASSPASFKLNRRMSTNVPMYGGENVSDPDTAPITKGIQEMVKLRDPLALSRLWERVLEPGVGIQLETHRYYLRSYPGTFHGRALVAWLMAQDSQTSTSHSQAVAIGQALLTAGLMTAVSGQGVFSDTQDLYQPSQIEENTTARTPEPSVQEPAWLQELADSPFRPEKKNSNSSQRPAESKVRGGDMKDNETVPDGLLGVGVGDLKKSVADLEDSEDSELLESVFRSHEDRYLDSLLTAENIPDEWRETILSLAEKAGEMVKPDVRYSGDEMDIRAYVKVKCVAWGQREDSRLVEGEVCSLKLAHKGMAANIHKPRIALVAESIMFKDRNTMVSLESIQLQEAEYVKNVIGKLLDSRPNIVLVEKTVTNLAQEIFLKEGVSLAVNVKPRLLQRLARLTQAVIIKSVDSMIAPPKLGSCEEFISQMSTCSSGRRGTRLMVFDGCSPSLGVAIILRGGDRQFLGRVKAVLKRILLIKYNWKHEKSLLANEYGSLMDSNVTQEKFGQYQLAVSPFIKVLKNESPIPFAVEAQDVSDMTEDDNNDDKGDSNHPQYQLHPWCKDFIEMKITSLTDVELGDKTALFRAAGWRQFPPSPLVIKPKVNYSVILPEDHTENLSVQFSMYSKQSQVAPNYCVSPWVVNMQLYGTLDIGLGDFLDSLCFSSDYACPAKQCSTPPLHHTRRFCHAGGAVSLHMQQLEAPIMGEDTDRLMMWKYCTSCEMITNIVPVSDSTWSLSFAMFLHILLHENQLVRRGASRPDATCSHSLHQEHLTCFGKGDQVATFRYSKLHVWDISTPPDKLAILSPSYSKDYIMKYLMEYKKAGSSVYSTVQEKLHQAKVENADSSCSLLTEHKEEHQAYRDRVEKLEEKINESENHGVETVSLLRLLQRDILVTQQTWMKRLSSADMAGKNVKKGMVRANSTEVVDSAGKKADTDTTVKKLISTILPHTEENILPNPFPQDIHLITHIKGVELDCPNPYFVTENKPSSLISYLLSSPSYQEYLTSEEEEEHFVLEVSDLTTKFYCCSYFTKDFHQLRKLIFPNGEKNFVHSLADCSRWEAMGGKSGLLFYKTRDDRFVLKQMSRFEYQSFLEFAPHYFQYLQKSIQSGTKTLLGKIVGVFKIGFKNSASGTGMNMEFLIMENLFFDKEVTKSYDLKGSVRNRLITEGESQSGQVLLDENLVRVSCESPLYINQQDKEVLNEAVKRDTAFLASHHMMDYSLLAGICDKDNKLVVGIIDYIRTFTWDKKLETLVKSVKSSGVFGGQAKTPTVINPDLYQMRFSDAMNRYFSAVPE